MHNKKWICLRGLGRGNGHWADFREVVNSLDKDVDLEYLEVPGNGTLNQEITPVVAEEVIERLKKISRIANQNSEFNIIGMSLGGMLALKWAELYPKQVKKVIIINSSLWQFSPIYKRLQPRQMLKLGRSATVKNAVERETLVLDVVSNNKARISQFLQKNAEFTKKYPTQLSNLTRQLILAKFITINHKNIEAQVLVLCSEHDRMVDISCSKAIAKNFDFELAIHPTAGHDLPFDEPEWLAHKLISL